MIFPIAELLDEQQSVQWMEKYFHPKRLRCPGCGAATKFAREFRTIGAALSIIGAGSPGVSRTSTPAPSSPPLTLSRDGSCSCCAACARASLLPSWLRNLAVAPVRRPPAQADPRERLCAAERGGALGRGDRDRRDVSERGGKKATATPILPTRRGGVRTSGAATAPTRMTDRRWSAPSGDGAGSVGCGSASIRMGRRCGGISTVRRCREPLVTRTSGGATTGSSGHAAPSVTVKASGRETMTGTGCERCIPTPSRGCGRRRATSCGPSAGCIRST